MFIMFNHYVDIMVTIMLIGITGTSTMKLPDLSSAELFGSAAARSLRWGQRRVQREKRWEQVSCTRAECGQSCRLKWSTQEAPVATTIVDAVCQDRSFLTRVVAVSRR